jgi:hypothetical protein
MGEYTLETVATQVAHKASLANGAHSTKGGLFRTRADSSRSSQPSAIPRKRPKPQKVGREDVMNSYITGPRNESIQRHTTRGGKSGPSCFSAPSKSPHSLAGSLPFLVRNSLSVDDKPTVVEIASWQGRSSTAKGCAAVPLGLSTHRKRACLPFLLGQSGASQFFVFSVWENRLHCYTEPSRVYGA